MAPLNKLTFLAILSASILINGCKKELITKGANNMASTVQTPGKNLVLFPGAGLVPADQVHIIEPGNYLYKKNGHFYKMEKGTDRMIEDFGVPKKAVTINQQNKNLNFGNGASYKRIQSSNNTAMLPMASGGNANWATYAYWQNLSSEPISYFSTTWVVPGPPLNYSPNQSIFI